MVRVLSRKTPSRALMRGHTGSILELSFFEHLIEGGALPHDGIENGNSSSAEAVDLLASTAKDGNILLWKIDSPSSDTIVYLLSLPVLILIFITLTIIDPQ
jgi:hypothetical protein